MKKFILKSATVLLMAIIFIACKEEEQQNLPVNEPDPLVAIPSDMGGIKLGGVVLPNGTKSQLSDDGSSLKVKLPEGIMYIASMDDELISTDEGGYTCTSDCSGGCDVVKLGEDVGCTACPRGSTDPCVGEYEDEGFYSIGQGSGGGFINLNQGISFVSRSDERIENFQSPDWDVLIQHPEVEQKVTEFINGFWPEGKIDYDNSKLVLTNVFGTYVRLNIPNSFFANSRVANDLVEGEDVSCDCSSGDIGCVHEDITAGPFNTKIGDKCVAGECQSCTMRWQE